MIMSKQSFYYSYRQKKTTFTILLYILIISLIGCKNRDYSGVTSYCLPDGMTFTIWEKESGVYGSDVLIIPGAEYSGKGIEPNVSYIKTIYSSHSVFFYYSLDTVHQKHSFFKDTIIFRPFLMKENDYQIINKPNSPYYIIEYSNNLDKYIYFDLNEKIEMYKTIRNDVSCFEKIMNDYVVRYRIGHKIRIEAR